MRKSVAVYLLTALTATLVAVDASEVRPDILGLRLEMKDADVRKRLSEVGALARKERKRQEVWTVRDDAFSHVVVGFEKSGELRYVTAVARNDREAKRIRYEEVARIADAKQVGDPAVKNFNYVWTFPAEEGKPAMEVIARGRDETFLDTYSLKRTVTEADAEAEEDD